MCRVPRESTDSLLSEQVKRVMHDARCTMHRQQSERTSARSAECLVPMAGGCQAPGAGNLSRGRPTHARTHARLAGGQVYQTRGGRAL